MVNDELMILYLFLRMAFEYKIIEYVRDVNYAYVYSANV